MLTPREFESAVESDESIANLELTRWTSTSGGVGH